MAPSDQGVDERLLHRGGVGFFGCSAGRGTVVRVGATGDKPPRSLVVDCPACGSRHRAAITWRKPTELDEGMTPDLIVEAAGD